MTLLITVLLLGILASLSPSTIVVFILVLATTRARVNAAAFLIGWTVSLVAVFLAAAFVAGVDPFRSEGRSLVVKIVEILLGIAFVGAGARQWRRRDQPRSSREGPTRLFAGRLKELNPVEATLVGVLKQPWAITAAAAVTVARREAAFPVALVAFMLFTAASTATVAVTYVYYARRPEEAGARLEKLRARLVAAGPTLLAVVAVAVGAYLMLDGFFGPFGV